MHAPVYRWRCHKCELVNEPDLTHCTHCGFPAVASAAEIAEALGEPNPIGVGYRAVLRGLAWLLAFPAMLPWPFK